MKSTTTREHDTVSYYRTRRPKRSRYTAWVSKPNSNKVEQIDILEYSAERAAALAQSNGYTLLEGPALKRDVIRQKSAARTWNIDQSAVRAKFLALTGREIPRCLTIKVETATTRQGGFIVHADGRLTLTVNAAESAERASEVLWHELCHLHQYLDRIESDPVAAPGTRAAYNIQRGHQRRERASRVGYLNRPSEREARSWEPLGETDPLVKNGG